MVGQGRGGQGCDGVILSVALGSSGEMGGSVVVTLDSEFAGKGGWFVENHQVRGQELLVRDGRVGWGSKTLLLFPAYARDL